MAIVSTRGSTGGRAAAWILNAYGLLLCAAAAAITLHAPQSSWWWVYGFACDLLGPGCLFVGVLRLRRLRDLSVARSGVAVSGPIRPRPRSATPAAARPAAPRVRPNTSTLSAAGGLPGLRLTQFRVIRSEWTKFHSLRSSKIILLISGVLIVGMAAVLAAVVNAQWDKLPPAARAKFNPAADPLAGVAFAQLAVGLLGVLLFSGEYGTGMIRASLTVVPQRLRLVGGKLTVLVGAVGAASLASTFIAFCLAQAMLSRKHLNTHLGAPHALRPLVAAAVYLVLIGVIGVALGVLLRHTAAAVCAIVALLFVLPIVLNFLPAAVSKRLATFVPTSAGEAFWVHPANGPSPWAGLAILLGWTGILLILGVSRLLTEDV